MAKSLNDLIPSDDEIKAAEPDIERLEKLLHADLQAEGLHQLASMLPPGSAPGSTPSAAMDVSQPGQVYFNPEAYQAPPPQPEAAPEPEHREMPTDGYAPIPGSQPHVEATPIETEEPTGPRGIFESPPQANEAISDSDLATAISDAIGQQFERAQDAEAAPQVTPDQSASRAGEDHISDLIRALNDNTEELRRQNTFNETRDIGGQEGMVYDG